MKSSDTPNEPTRSYLPRLVDGPPPTEEGTEREEKFQPRYVDLPALRERGHGPRNLAWGAVMFLVALFLLSLAVFLAGPKAAISVGTCLLTFAALFVLSRLHLFRQRNGGFLALSIICLLGSLVALVERGFVAADTLLKNQAVAASAPAAARPAESDLPLLTQSFALSTPDARKRQVKVLRDSRVIIGEKPFAIKAGDLFPLLESKPDEAIFAVRDLHIALPSNVVEVVEPAAEVKKTLIASESAAPDAKAKAASPASPSAKPADPVKSVANEELAVLSATMQKEAILRYPALGVKDSRENKLYVATYKELKSTGDQSFFANPEWPIVLADDLAKREGWSRESQTAPGGLPSADGLPVSDGGSPAPAGAGASPAPRPVADPDTLPPDDTPSVIPKSVPSAR